MIKTMEEIMANEQIQKLTSVLYQEGIEKGEKKAEEIIEEARLKAKEIIDKARKDSEAILKETEEKSKAYKTHVETETRIAAKEIIHDFHHRVIDLILVKAIDEKTSKAFSESDTVKAWISKILENWKINSREEPSLDILLPEKDRKEFEEWFKKETLSILGKSNELKFTDSLEGGFQIVPENGAFKIQITPESFEELFRHYLKARTRKLLFGE